MDHMTFTTIFSLLTTVGMALLMMWGMSNVDPQGQREAAQQPFNLPARGKKKGTAYQTQDPVRARRYPMTCLRCDGLMVHEKFEDLDGLWSSDHEFTGWRCLNCGAIVDPVIAAHKRITSSQGAPFITGPWPMKLTLSTPFRRKHNAKT